MAFSVLTSGAVASLVGAICSVDQLFVGYVGFVVPVEAGTANERSFRALDWSAIQSPQLPTRAVAASICNTLLKVAQSSHGTLWFGSW